MALLCRLVGEVLKVLLALVELRAITIVKKKEINEGAAELCNQDESLQLLILCKAQFPFA